MDMAHSHLSTVHHATAYSLRAHDLRPAAQAVRLTRRPVCLQDDDGSEPVHSRLHPCAGRQQQEGQREAATIERTILLLEKATPAELVTQRLARLIDADSRIWELRPGRHRVAMAVVDGVYVLLHAWRKTTPKLSRRELSRSRARLEGLR